MKQALILLFCIGCTFLFAQTPGSLDLTYGTNGKIISNTIGRALEMRKSSSGEIFIVGGDEGSTGTYTPTIEKYLANGTPDVTFGNNGKVHIQVPNSSEGELYDVELTTGGKIMVAGNIVNTDANPDVDFFSAQLLPDGSLDPSYGTNGITVAHVTESLEKIYNGEIQTDGKLLCFGPGIDPANNKTSILLARFNTNGSLDNTFGTNGIAYYNVNGNMDNNYASAIQTDNKLVLTGWYTNSSSSFRKSYVARFNTDGSIDNTFGTNGVTTTIYNGSSYHTPYATTIQSDGKILIAGGIYNGIASNQTYYDFMITRYNVNGTIDPAFGSGGYLMLDKDSSGNIFYDIIIVNNEIIATGVSGHKLNGNTYNTDTYDMVVARYDMNGAIDNTFGTNGYTIVNFDGSWDQAYGILYDNVLNKLIVCGFETNTNMEEHFALMRLNYDNNVGIEEQTKTNGLMIYPNPNNGTFIIQSAVNTDLDIINGLGQIIATAHLSETNNNQFIITNLQNGMYVIQGKDGDKTCHQKIIVNQ